MRHLAMLFATSLRRLSNHSAARVLGAAALLSCALLAGGGSIAHAEHARLQAIDSICIQQWRDPSGAWHTFRDGEQILDQGTPLRIGLYYLHYDDANVSYPVAFTASTNTNIYLGPQHTVDSAVVWGGGGRPGQDVNWVDLPTTDWPDGKDRILIEVTSDATGNTVLGRCDFSLTLTPNPVLDSDGDSLLNTWETNGIDVDHDGTVDLPLHQDPYGADPHNPDIFVEIDYMSCLYPGPWSTCNAGDTHNDRPSSSVLRDVVRAFDHQDTTLHAMRNGSVPHVNNISFGPGATPDFGDLKHGLATGGTTQPCGTGQQTGSFGTSTDRSSPNCEQILLAKLLVFHYAIFGHSYAETPGSSGVSDGANDFLVTLGSWSSTAITNAGGLRVAQAGTFMHELGHDLGLGHGGDEGDRELANCKPNYRSVMNYTRQFRNIDPNRPLDYSREALADLNEGALSEPAGIGTGVGGTAIFGRGGVQTMVTAGGGIDWNGGGITPAPDTVAADINRIGTIRGCNTASPSQSLGGYDDWQNLRYSFRGQEDFADETEGTAVSPPIGVTEKLTSKSVVASYEAADHDSDGVKNGSDNCVNARNPNQANTDGDSLGNACDPNSS